VEYSCSCRCLTQADSGFTGSREFNVVFRVMLDPEGNEFCLVMERD